MRAYVLPLSARSEGELVRVAEHYRDTLWLTPAAALGDICRRAAEREHLPHRLAVVASSPQELAGRITTALAMRERVDAVPAIAFVFSGLGAYWPGMGAALERFPVFRRALADVHAAWRRVARRPLGDASALERIHATTFAVQAALAEQLRALGIAPAAVAGQSLGEVAAVYTAGALDLDDAVRVVFHGTRLMEDIAGRGVTAYVGLPERDVTLLLAGHDRVRFAGQSGPDSCLVSGDAAAVEHLLERARGRGARARRLEGIDVALHGPDSPRLARELALALDALAPRPARIPFFSSLVAGRMEGDALSGEYWGRALAEPFRLADTMRGLVESGVSTLIEISPRPMLVGMIRDTVAAAGSRAQVLGTLARHGEEHALLTTVARLYARGVAIDWQALFDDAPEERRVPPGDDGIEQQLMRLLCDVARCAPADPDRPLADLGLDSILTFELKALIEDTFGVELSFSDTEWSDDMTLRDLARAIAARTSGALAQR